MLLYFRPTDSAAASAANQRGRWWRNKEEVMRRLIMFWIILIKFMLLFKHTFNSIFLIKVNTLSVFTEETQERPPSTPTSEITREFTRLFSPPISALNFHIPAIIGCSWDASADNIIAGKPHTLTARHIDRILSFSSAFFKEFPSRR